MSTTTADQLREPAPVAILRGARVSARTATIRRGVLSISVLGLAVLTALLFFNGVQKNARLDALHHHGVTVGVRVTDCRGLLGGSGSNAAGYTCRGTYAFAGHRYTATIPGTGMRAGKVVAGVIDPNEPQDLATPESLANEHPSAAAFVAPAILLAILVLIVGVAGLRRSGSRSPLAIPAAAGTR